MIRNDGFDFGTLVISLDFELMWGILDWQDPLSYEENVRGVYRAIPEILSLFHKHGIHATWGTVGMIACRDYAQWKEGFPSVLPEYEKEKLSPYHHGSELQRFDASLLFAPDMISRIASTEHQEIASHTYSHYYCREAGQTKEAYSQDLKCGRNALTAYNPELRSLILPRNQSNPDYAEIQKENGLINYRGTERAGFWGGPGIIKGKRTLNRALRLVDSYISLSGHNCYPYQEIKDANGLNNIRSSRFLRPYSKRFSFLEPLKIHRIKRQMKYAAKNHKVFHMWWHPHNFGVNTEENIRNLTEIVEYFENLKREYGMRSLNLSELGEMIK